MNQLTQLAVRLWHQLYFRQHNYIIELTAKNPVEIKGLNFVEFTPQLLAKLPTQDQQTIGNYICQGFTGVGVLQDNNLVGCGFIALEQAIQIGHNIELNLQQTGFIFEPIIFANKDRVTLRLATISHLCQQYSAKKIFCLIDMEHSSAIEELRKIGYELLMILDTTRVFKGVFFTKTTKISPNADVLDAALRVAK